MWDNALFVSPLVPFRLGSTMQQTDAKPSGFLWFLHGVTVILLSVGVYAAFPLPLITWVWGMIQLRRVE